MLLFLFGKGEWRNRNEKSVEIRNEEIGKIEERRNAQFLAYRELCIFVNKYF